MPGRGPNTAATTAAATSRTSTKSRYAPSGPSRIRPLWSARAWRSLRTAWPATFSAGSPGPTGLNTRSTTPSSRPSATARSTSRVAASRVIPYVLTGRA